MDGWSLCFLIFPYAAFPIFLNSNYIFKLYSLLLLICKFLGSVIFQFM